MSEARGDGATAVAAPPAESGSSGRSGLPGLGRLLAVEWLRLRSRRAFPVLTLLGFLGVGLSLAALGSDARPPSAQELAAAEELAEQQAQEPFVQDEIERCEEAVAAGDDSQFGPGFDCGELVPRAEWFVFYDHIDFAERAVDALVQPATVFGLVALLLGATFSGADWSAGTIGTQLLYEPRRGRLFAAKTVVVALALMLAAAVAVALVAAVLYAIAAAWGSTDGAAAVLGDLVVAGLRALVVVGAAGAIGVAIALAFRRSIVVLGLVMAYLFVGEGLLRGAWSGAEPWLASSRLSAWLRGGHEVVQFPESCGFAKDCQPITTSLSTADGGIYLAAVTLVLLAVSYVVFRRRDVG